MLIRFASAMPRARPMLSKQRCALSLPPRASLIYVFGARMHAQVVSKLAMLTMAVAEACFSRQPQFPHPQGFPSGITVMCPSSPAIPR